MLALKGKEYTASTIQKSLQMQKGVTDFMNDVLGVSDIPLSKVDIKFLNEFEFYLKEKRNMAVASYNKIIQKLKSVMKLAYEYGAIQRPAFPNHKFRHEKNPLLYFLQWTN